MNENIPEFLLKKLESQYGKEIMEMIIKGYECNRKTTFRVNSLKSNVDEICDILETNNINYSKVEWYEDALIVENDAENKLSEMDIYKSGKIYLQSLSSMIPPVILSPKESENILDMAAAPGGKTTQLYNISKGKAHITACEKNKIRAERLKYNIEKQGATRIGILMQDARKLDDLFTFDKILLDAPCSGSGTLNVYNKKMMENFSEELVDRSVKVQKELINKALRLINIGNEMVYSTCSIFREENEAYLQKLVKKDVIEILPIDKLAFRNVPLLPVKLEGTLCVCPNTFYEGFFVTKFKRKK